MREEQRDEYLRERSKLKRLEELAQRASRVARDTPSTDLLLTYFAQGYVPPSAESAQSSAAAKRQRPE
eukprot:scaffold14634_cov61-Phaeocystis_antarctica.AAC.3